MKIAITDDEKKITDAVQQMLEQYLADHGIPAEFVVFHSPQEFLDSLEQGGRGQYSLVMMDIYFEGEEMTGVDAIRKLREEDRHSYVIFLTSSGDHMPDAFHVHAFSYIMKDQLEESLPEVMDDLISTMPVARSISLTSGKKNYIVPISDIIYIQTEGHYLLIRVQGEEDLRVRMTFSEIMQKLAQAKEFLLITKGLVVNMDHIRKFENKNAIMTDGSVLPVRVRGYAGVVRQWHEYNFDKLRSEHS